MFAMPNKSPSIIYCIDLTKDISTTYDPNNLRKARDMPQRYVMKKISFKKWNLLFDRLLYVQSSCGTLHVMSVVDLRYLNSNVNC